MRRLNLALSFLAVVGCAPSPDKPGAEPITGATANEAGSAMASSIEDGASGYRRAPDQPAPAFAVLGSAGEGEFIPDFCFSLRVGDAWTDVDADGYPSPAVHLDIACTFTGPDGEVTASGVLALSDTNPASAGFDSSYELDDLDVIVVGSASQYHITGNGGDTNSGMALGAGAFSLTHHEEQATRSEGLTPDGTLYASTDESYSWDMVLNVTGFLPGNDAPAGSLDVTGEWAVRVDQYYDEEIHQRSSTDVETLATLTLDPTCATNITSGSVRASFSDNGATASVDVVWTGCGAHTVTYRPPE